VEGAGGGERAGKRKGRGLEGQRRLERGTGVGWREEWERAGMRMGREVNDE
jgi:hypothetical protein